MFSQYAQKAMEHAVYEILQDDQSYYGEIPACPGVYANAVTLEKCRQELKEVLEEWLLLRIHKNLPIQAIDDKNIKTGANKPRKMGRALNQNYSAPCGRKLRINKLFKIVIWEITKCWQKE